MSRTTPCTLLAKLIVNHKPSHFRVENPIASVTLRVPIVTVKAIHAMRVTAVRDALQIVADNLDFLLAEWTRLHGPKGSKGK